MVLAWVVFLISAVFIFLASRGLVKSGEQIAQRTGLSRTFIGLLLLATATSLPEMATGASAVAIVGSTDLAAGDIFGSNLFNLMIIALLDLSYRDHALLATVGLNNLLPAILSGIIIALASLLVLLHLWDAPLPSWIFLLFTPTLFGFYSLTLFWLSRKERRSTPNEMASTDSQNRWSLGKPLLLYGISAAIVAVGGFGLASSGEEIAKATGWGASFVGTLFVAFSTSLPEVATSFAALRIGAKDMAIANMVGSNLFNTGVIAFTDDIFYRDGLFLGSVSSVHLITALCTIVMTGVVITGMVLRPRRKLLGRWTPEIALLLGLFFLAHYLVFTLSPAS